MLFKQLAIHRNNTSNDLRPFMFTIKKDGYHTTVKRNGWSITGTQDRFTNFKLELIF